VGSGLLWRCADGELGQVAGEAVIARFGQLRCPSGEHLPPAGELGQLG